MYIIQEPVEPVEEPVLVHTDTLVSLEKLTYRKTVTVSLFVLVLAAIISYLKLKLKYKQS